MKIELANNKIRRNGMMNSLWREEREAGEKERERAKGEGVERERD